MTSSKSTLRPEALRHRDRIDPGSEDTDRATELFFRHIKPQKTQTVSFYWPKGREFDPRGILERLLNEDIICALPVVRSDTRVLGFVQWREGDPLQDGPFGIKQPAVSEETAWILPDIVIVPLLAFDRRGHRMGYGGGYYDATLSALRAEKNITAVGVAYAQQAVLFTLPTEPHDEPLDWIITPQDAHCFKM